MHEADRIIVIEERLHQAMELLRKGVACGSVDGHVRHDHAPPASHGPFSAWCASVVAWLDAQSMDPHGHALVSTLKDLRLSLEQCRQERNGWHVKNYREMREAQERETTAHHRAARMEEDRDRMAMSLQRAHEDLALADAYAEHGSDERLWPAGSTVIQGLVNHHRQMSDLMRSVFPSIQDPGQRSAMAALLGIPDAPPSSDADRHHADGVSASG
jgi:hypothetical protein